MRLSPSGKVRDCKSLIVGSSPTSLSKKQSALYFLFINPNQCWNVEGFDCFTLIHSFSPACIGFYVLLSDTGSGGVSIWDVQFIQPPYIISVRSDLISILLFIILVVKSYFLFLVFIVRLYIKRTIINTEDTNYLICYYKSVVSIICDDYNSISFLVVSSNG